MLYPILFPDSPLNPLGSPKYTSPTSSLIITISRFFNNSGLSEELSIKELNKKIGLTLIYKSKDLRRAKSPDSGLRLFSLFSCFLVPTAPSKIQSASKHF